jgi:hypothetical protein
MRPLYLTFFLITTVLLFSSCKRDLPEYPFRIKVLSYDEEREVLSPVFLAEVFVAPDNPRSNVSFEGVTNSSGEVTFVYEYDAVFRIQARGTTYDIDTIVTIDSTGFPDKDPVTIYDYDTTAVYYKNGCGFIKLKENEEAYEEVIIEEWEPSMGDCF